MGALFSMASRIFRFGAAAAGTALFGVPAATYCHCQVPCGIFDDQMRIKQLKEDCVTIHKAMHQAGHLCGKGDALSTNQSVRWVMTKEEHAAKIITTVAEYFLTQKVKDPPPQSDTAAYQKYLATLACHHAVLRAAMKTKQTMDIKDAEALMKAIEALGASY